VRVDWTDGFDRFLSALEKDAEEADVATADGRVAVERLAHLGALLGELQELSAKPLVESATFKRVRQARRHELWRVAHPFLGDAWYARAATEGEVLVDQWQREHGG
jgi:hypothetical protein